MKSLSVLVALLSLLGLRTVASIGSGKPKDPIEQCTPPSKFEGKAQVVINVKGQFSPIHALGTSSIHVDLTNGRAALHVKVYFGSKERERSIIIADHTMYTTFSDLGIKICEQDPNETLSALLTNSTVHIRQDKLQGVPVQVWEMPYHDERGQGYVEVYLNQDTCLPVLLEAEVRGGYKKVRLIRENYFDVGDDESVVVTHTFYDVKEGVNDASVFIPPGCTLSGHHRRSKRYIYGHPHQDDLFDMQGWLRELVLLSAMADIDYYM